MQLKRREYRGKQFWRLYLLEHTVQIDWGRTDITKTKFFTVHVWNSQHRLFYTAEMYYLGGEWCLYMMKELMDDSGQTQIGEEVIYIDPLIEERLPYINPLTETALNRYHGGK